MWWTVDEALSLGKDLLGRTVIENDDERTMLGPKDAGEEFRGAHVDDFGMEDEGISANGSEGLGGHGDGFDIQGQGVTRRSPGEGPKADGGRSQAQEMDPVDQPQYAEGRERAFYENEMPWGGMQDPGGWDRQVASGITSGGTDVTDEGADAGRYRLSRDASGFTLVTPDGNEQLFRDERKAREYAEWHAGLEGQHAEIDVTTDGDLATFPPSRRFDIMRSQPKVREMFGIDEGRIVWAPGDTGADTKRITGFLDKKDPASLAQSLKLQQAGAYGTVEIDEEEATKPRAALTAALESRRLRGADRELAEDVLQQLDLGQELHGDSFGESKEIDAMKQSVRGMKHAVGRMDARAKDRSEKERRGKSDPAADTQDRRKLGEGVARVFIFKK
jgi:hypothetical protein